MTVRGVFGGETSFSGHGAGGSPTAVAVVSGRACRFAAARRRRRAAHDARRRSFHKVSGDFVAPHYVRFIVNDKPGILAQVTTAYAKYGINIDGVLQLPKFRKDRLPFVTTLEECSESVLDRALAEVAQSDYHVQPPLSLPIFLRDGDMVTASGEVVEAEGHLIDSQILNVVFDTVVKAQRVVRRAEVQRSAAATTSRRRSRCASRRDRAGARRGARRAGRARLPAVGTA